MYNRLDEHSLKFMCRKHKHPQESWHTSLLTSCTYTYTYIYIYIDVYIYIYDIHIGCQKKLRAFRLAHSTETGTHCPGQDHHIM